MGFVPAFNQLLVVWVDDVVARIGMVHVPIDPGNPAFDGIGGFDGICSDEGGALVLGPQSIGNLSQGEVMPELIDLTNDRDQIV